MLPASVGTATQKCTLAHCKRSSGMFVSAGSCSSGRHCKNNNFVNVRMMFGAAMQAGELAAHSETRMKEIQKEVDSIDQELVRFRFHNCLLESARAADDHMQANTC